MYGALLDRTTSKANPIGANQPAAAARLPKSGMPVTTFAALRALAADTGLLPAGKRCASPR